MSENQITATQDAGLYEKQIEAISLHKKILANGQIAAEALVEFSKDLKQMRDSKLYLQLGLKSFDVYCEQAVHIGQRQAYKFIKALDEFGEQKLIENAGLGITKLAALATLCSEDREELMEQENVAQLSTRELEDKIAEYKKKCEQLTLAMESETIDKEDAAKKAERLHKEKVALETQLRQLEEENKALKDKPVETVAAELSEKDLLEIKSKIASELEEESKKKIERIKAESADVNAKSKELQKKSEEKIKALEQKISDLQASSKNNKSTPPPSENRELIKYHFNAIQTAFNSAAEMIGKLKDDEKEQFKKATLKLLDGCKNAVEGV